MITIIFILLIAISFAGYMHQRLKIRREREHEKRMERFENLMDVLKKQNSDTNVSRKEAGSNTREDEENSRN
jgi:5-carboxymethyl-2-hydroxymuconate isomerase